MQHSIEVSGRVRFPRLCAHCGVSADQTLPISQTFTRKYTQRRKSGGRVTRHYRETTTFRVPFCTMCVAQHEQEVVRPTWRHYAQQAMAMLSYATAASVTLVLVVSMWTDWLQRDNVTLANGLGSMVFFVCGVLLPMYLGVHRSRHFVVSPPTSITSAVSFADKERQTWRTTTRKFYFKNSTYAQHFALENRERDSSWHLLGTLLS